MDDELRGQSFLKGSLTCVLRVPGTSRHALPETSGWIAISRREGLQLDKPTNFTQAASPYKRNKTFSEANPHHSTLQVTAVSLVRVCYTGLLRSAFSQPLTTWLSLRPQSH